MTIYSEITSKSPDELAQWLVNFFPVCYLCEYDDGPMCANPGICTYDYKLNLIKEWLNSED